MTERKILFSAVKNEAPFLLEWVAYHRAIGFDTILIVSNDSDDGTTELLDALHAAGVVHHIHHSVEPGASPQGRAAIAGNDSGVIRDGDWVIWLDADEFLNIHAGQGRLDDLLASLGAAQGALIPWRIFGDSGQATFPGRFVAGDFTRAALLDHDANRVIKTIYRHRDGQTRLSAVANHRPHLMVAKHYRNTDFLNGNGGPLSRGFRPNNRWLAGVEGKGNFAIPPEDYGQKFAQINHYMLRTRDMFDLKAHRGRGFVNIVKGKPVTRPRHTPEFFVAQNRNEDEDSTILRHQDATTREIAALMADPAVAAAQAQGMQRTAARLAAMRQEAESWPELFAPTVSMPAEERALVEATYAAHDVILEYGSGGSTMLAASQDHSLIMAVESDRAWADNLRAVIARDHPAAKVHIHWSDIGPTGKWGRPVGASGWARYHRYPLDVWDQPWFRQPDLVLIDGRFRVGCLLAVMARATRPVTVLFDDYANRPHYVSVVETFVRPVQVVGRMARFQITPGPLPPDRLTDIVAAMSRPD